MENDNYGTKLLEIFRSVLEVFWWLFFKPFRISEWDSDINTVMSPVNNIVWSRSKLKLTC